MYVCVCMYVCMYYVCMCTQVHTYMHDTHCFALHKQRHVRMYVRICIHADTYIIYIQTYAHCFTSHKSLRVRMYVCMYVCIYTYIHTYMTYMTHWFALHQIRRVAYMYVCMYIHTRTYTQIHT